jgi:hypothetical protein
MVFLECFSASLQALLNSYHQQDFCVEQLATESRQGNLCRRLAPITLSERKGALMCVMSQPYVLPSANLVMDMNSR